MLWVKVPCRKTTEKRVLRVITAFIPIPATVSSRESYTGSNIWRSLDHNGSSVLTLAAEFSNSKTFKYVLEKSGLKLSSRDGSLRNSLECAISGGNFENVKFIINHAEGKSLVDILPENVLFECFNLDTDSFDKIRELLVPILQVRIKNVKERITKLDKSGENLKLAKSEEKKIHQVLQVEFQNIENTWVAIYDEFKLVHPSFEMEESHEKVVFEKASADRIVMEQQQQLVVTDWGNVANKLKEITHKAKSSFEISDYNDQPENLISTSFRGFKRKNPFSKIQSTGNGVELPAQYQRIVTDGYSLEGDKAKNEISKIVDCDDQKALMKYICLSFKSKLESTIQRIRRKLIYIVSYRRHQLSTRQVGLDASFNKYTTVHPDRPMYSAKSMLKLIRWCRFFEREYKPIISILQHVPSSISDTIATSCMGLNTKHQFSSASKKPKIQKFNAELQCVQFTRNRLDKDESIFFQRVLFKLLPIHGEKTSENLNLKSVVFELVNESVNPLAQLMKHLQNDFTQSCLEHSDTLIKNHMLNQVQQRVIQPFKQEKNPENILTENCIICQNKEHVEYDYGVPICQTCYFRRNLFLYGSELKCVKCDVQLRDDNFEAYIGESWCKRCVGIKMRDIVESDGSHVNLLEKGDFMMSSRV